ncbi:MAG: hypothetical protein R3B13_35960 [Polyangiaceae bacterium]
MHRFSLFVPVLSTLLLVACKGPEPGETATLGDVCTAKFDPAADGTLKRVTVEGFLAIPEGMFLMCSDTCGLELRASPGDKKGLRINLRIGGGKNRMEKLPKKYSDSDLKVNTSDGNTVGVGAKIRVTGGRLGSEADNTCQIYNVDLIQGA